ncbi:DNA ligase, partial [Escherichia coli]|nr:DNA ligase [Escherichia coli]
QSVSALRKKNVKAIGAVYHIFDFFLPEWRAQAKSKEYLKTGMKLKERLAMLVALFRNTCVEDYAQDIHLHPFYIIHSHEDFIERFMKRLDENEEGEMGKDPDSVYEFKRTRSWW